MTVFLLILAALLATMGIIILIGKGDNLIAGYNTASKQERAKYDIRRLRGLIGGLLLILAPTVFLLHGEPSTRTVLSFSSLVFVLSIAAVVLANTWARKK